MALYTEVNRADLLNRLMTVSAGDTIQLPGGVVFEEFRIPKNLVNITIRAANLSTAPIMRGIMVGSGNLEGNFSHLTSAPYGSSVNGLTLDGLLFKAERFTSCKDPNNVTRSLIMPDGQGLGWRVCGTSHPSGNLVGYSENANYYGVRLSQGTNNTTLRNLTFNGFANAFKTGFADNTLIQFCDFEENCEDLIKFASFAGYTAEYLKVTNMRGATSTIDDYQGWKNSEPPHADTFQQMNSGSDLIIRKCYIEDDQYRLHGGLIRHSQQGSGQTNHVTLENMELHTSHPTGFLISDTTNLICRYNKITALGPLSGGGPTLQIDPGGTNITPSNISNNQSVRLGGLASGATGSSTNNNPNTYPSGFVQIQQSKVTSGQPFAGVYGQGGVTLPTKPPTLTNAADALMSVDWVQDPNLPLTDERRTGYIRIRKNGLAGNASEVRWQSAADTVSRGTVEITGDATYRYFRMNSNNLSHLLYPGDPPITGIQILYVDPAISSTARSDLSTFTIQLNAPPQPVEQVWVPSQFIDFPTYLGFYHEGDSILEIYHGGESLWKKPAPALVGLATSGTIDIPQPVSPSSYTVGDFLLALAYRSGTGLFTNPTPTFWSEVIAGGQAGNSQAIALIKGFATAVGMTLGSFSGVTGKTMAISLRGVHTTTPLIYATSMNASGLTCNIPAITLPTDFDNWRVLLLTANVGGVSMSNPDSTKFNQIGTTGGSPRIYAYLSKDAMSQFAGGSNTLGSASVNTGITVGLRLAA